MKETTIFEALGGLEGVSRLAQAWHSRVLADEVVSHAFSHGFHPHHVDRLAAYWSEVWGGPALYTGSCGTASSVVRIHSGNGEHDEMDRRAIHCFERALDDLNIKDSDLSSALLSYFTWAIKSVAAYPNSAKDVPDGLQMPRWSWNGLEN